MSLPQPGPSPTGWGRPGGDADLAGSGAAGSPPEGVLTAPGAEAPPSANPDPDLSGPASDPAGSAVAAQPFERGGQERYPTVPAGGASPPAPGPSRVPRGRRGRGLPGGRVVLVATLVVVTAAMAEVALERTIALWAGAALVAVSVVAALVTRAGDRSLPAMMPPLAFATAVLIAGQALVDPGISDPWRRQGVMLVEYLGRNAVWVVTATALALLIATLGHVHDRHRRLRSTQQRPAGS